MRQGLRAGVEGYSLKDVEALAAFRRQAHLKSGTRAVLAYEQWIATRQDTWLKEIEAYNDEDCRATLALRDWLVTQRPDGATWAERPATREVDDAQQARDVEREALRQALVAGAEVGSPRWLVGELLEYHRREARPAWWWFFARCGMSLDELFSGTNSGDRRQGAEAVVRRLLDSGAIGLLTTHDLALTHLAAQLGPCAVNVHFTEQFTEGVMTFDYRMRAGVLHGRTYDRRVAPAGPAPGQYLVKDCAEGEDV